MRIYEIIQEERHVPLTVAHDPAEAEEKFNNAEKGKAGSAYDVRTALKRVRDRYGVEVLDDNPETMGHPGKKNSDKKDSMLTKDNR